MCGGPSPKIDRRTLLQGTTATFAAGLTPPQPIEVTYDSIILGDRKIKVYLHKNDTPHGLTYFAPHYSETTAPQAAQDVIDVSGGKVAWLVHGDQARPARNISFVLDGTRFEFDPNRMFTDVGARKSLAQFSNTNTKSPAFARALAEVRRFATTLLTKDNDYLHPAMANGNVVVGIHNNHGSGYTVESYETGGEYHADIVDPGGYFYNQDGHPGNFFYTTSEAIFAALKSNNFSVVLQSTKPIDDGSLSVYCGAHRVDYVNVEATLGDRSAQRRMIQFLHDYIKSQT